MKRFFLCIIFLLVFFSQLVFADETETIDTIWENEDKSFVEDLTGEDNLHQEKVQELLDIEISHNLNIDLEYTNLKKCLELALENNYDIKISENIYTAKKWAYYNANSQFVPNLYYEYTLRRISGEYLVGTILLDKLTETPIINDFSFGWLQVNFAKLFFNSKSAKNIYNASRHELNFTKDETILYTSTNYYNLLAKKLELEVLRINLIEREHQLKITQGRYAIGIGTKFDILRAEAQVAEGKREFITAYNSLRLEQAKLANIIGIEVLEPIYPYEININTIRLIDEKFSIEDLYKLALSAREDVKAQEKKIASLKQQKLAVYSDYAPTVSAYYTHEYLGLLGERFRSNNTIGIVANFHLGKNLGIGTYTAQKSVDAQIAEQENILIQLKRNIKEHILNSFYESRTSIERIEAAKKEVAAGDEGLKNAMVRWEIGENTFLDVLQAQNTKTTARQEYISSVVSFNKAQIKLLFDAGIISAKAVLTGYPLFEENNPHNIQ